MKTILLTNDDGIDAVGLAALKAALKDHFDVYTVAPHHEQSGSSHSLTLAAPLRIETHDERTFSVNGTPTDCVMLALNKILPRRPDILVSGINYGQNMGDDVTYSGTVSAAFEGTLMGISSVAVSLVIRGQQPPYYFDDAARVTLELIVQIIEQGFPDDMLLNINIPNLPHGQIKGVAVTKLGKRTYENTVVEKHDPRGKPYYWIGGTLNWESIPASDFYALDHQLVSITPLHLDLTNYQTIPVLEKWALHL